MPHLILSCSSNVMENENKDSKHSKNRMDTLFERCHALLAEALPTNIEGCKSRAHIYDVFRVGRGESRNAFVHVDLKILPGRDELLVGQLGEKLMEVLLEHFADARRELDLQITLDITELKNYFKIAR